MLTNKQTTDRTGKNYLFKIIIETESLLAKKKKKQSTRKLTLDKQMKKE